MKLDIIWTKTQSFWEPLALFSDSQLKFWELFMKPLPSWPTQRKKYPLKSSASSDCLSFESTPLPMKLTPIICILLTDF